MRTCQSCGRENATDVDFCECGEYLRWEPTQYQLEAVTPPEPDEAPAVQDAPPSPTSEPPAQRSATPPAPASQTDPPPPESEERFISAVRPAVPPPRRKKPATKPPVSDGRTTPGSAPGAPTRRMPASPPPQPPPAAAAAAAISLRLAGDEPGAGSGKLEAAIVPGDRLRVTALVRNQDTIVDNYTLAIDGLPSEWYTVIPETVYLVPYGSAGIYEQEIEIQLHPPRAPEAQARRWELSVGVVSRSRGDEVASAPMTLGIHPYEDYTVRVRPERASGRRRAKYDVTIANEANALVILALGAHDGDDECDFEFEHETVEITAEQTRTVRLLCKPPKQIWLGRPLERRFEIACASGEEGEKLLKAKAQARREEGKLTALAGKASKMPGVSAPKVNMPNVSVGPDGVPDVRLPKVRGPGFQGVNLRRPTLGLKALRTPGRGEPVAPSAPLLPKQAIFRQKAWLPWWLAIVLPLLALLALALFLLLPKSVEVPNVVGSKTVFEAEKKLIGAGLQLKGRQMKPTSDAPPGSVLGQSPAAGESVEKGSPVSLEIAVGKGDTIVPKLAGLTLPEADKALRAKGLQKGTLSVQSPDPKLKIASTIPAAGETVKKGTPIDIFYGDPKAAGGGAKGGGAAGAGAGAGAGAKDIAVPAIDPADQQGYAAVLSRAGLVPVSERAVDSSPPGTVFATDPPPGTKVAKGATVTMLVSVGFPRIAFDDDSDILLASGASGERFEPPIAATGAVEKDPTWSADGARIVYTADGRLFSADARRRGLAASPLVPEGERYGDPSFAPTKTRSVLAASLVRGEERDLCVGPVTVDGYIPQCMAEAGFSVGFAHWSPDGRRILAAATSDEGFGIVQYTSQEAFSPRRSDWGEGEFVTPRSPDSGVLDVAISPDGKRLAAIANIDTPVPQLYITTPRDIRLRKSDPLPIGACKVMWLDSRILALVKLGEACDQAVGEIVRINVEDPTTATPLATAGDNPTFQPLSAEG